MVAMAVSVKVKSTNKSYGSSRDYSIYDFAHSTKTKARAPKSNVLPVEEPYDILDALDDHVSPSRKLEAASEEEIVYCDHVIDVWYLISEHVRPEDVCRFALICRKTAEVVQSAKFWQFLYRKHYNHKVDLPRRLQPDFMLVLRGLRARVIRSLYYTYPPFVHRLAVTAFADPHRVAGRQLLFAWHIKCKTGWNYYFKLKSRLIPGSRAEQSARRQLQRTSLDFPHDTYVNSEEGCQILIITTDTLHLIPRYNEKLVVKSLIQTLSQGLVSYKVRLQMANYCQRIVDEIVFVPVRQVRVLDWWNPEYYREDPTVEQHTQQDSLPDPLNSDTDNVFWDD